MRAKFLIIVLVLTGSIPVGAQVPKEDRRLRQDPLERRLAGLKHKTQAASKALLAYAASLHPIRTWAIKRGVLARAKYATTSSWHPKPPAFKIVQLKREGSQLRGFVEFQRCRDEFSVNVDSIDKLPAVRLVWTALFHPQRLPVSYVGVGLVDSKRLGQFKLPAGSVTEQDGLTICRLTLEHP